MMTELLTTAALFYLVAFVQLSCYGWIVFQKTAPKLLRAGAGILALVVSYKVVTASSTLIGFLLSQ